jgi:hypothetical protein
MSGTAAAPDLAPADTTTAVVPEVIAAVPVVVDAPATTIDPVVSAPVVEADPVAPVDPVTPEPAAAAAPAAPEAPALVPHTDTPTLMQRAGKVEAKPGDAPVEPVAPAEPVVPTYEPFTLPEGLSIQPEKLDGYTTILGKHGLTQEAGQELLGLYIAERQRDAVDTLAQQHQAFADMRKGWADQAKTDPEIGNANHNTAMDAVATVRDRFVPQSGPVREAFDKMLSTTGVGDHPEFLRFVARIGAALREPAPPLPGRPPPDVGRRPGGRNGAAVIYDNPTSPAPRH